MRKELLFAILIGVIIGLAIAFGIWRANKAFLPQRSKEAVQIPSISPEQQEEKIKTSQLVITAPENNLVVSTERVTVEGTAIPGSSVVITANAGELIAETQADGSFKEEIELLGGANEVKVAAYDKDGNKSEQTVTVVYSTEFGGEEQ
ncbi:MAG: hypothetical protein HYU80_03795 [Candidatus Blackburnbacteria bacterium]|nr:hypothetical protein [Candidatus Blackburnbacteria bacterium]